jgi:hypothetical protein
VSPPELVTTICRKRVVYLHPAELLQAYPADLHRGKKVYMRGLARHPSGPLPSMDILETGRVDARRLLRPPPLAASPHHGWFTPPLAGATAARGTGAPPGGSRHDRSVRLPWLAYGVATAWPNRCRWWARAGATAGVRSHGANRSYNRHARRPTAAAHRPRPCTAR